MQSVVVHYLNGQLRKGVTGDFHPNTNRFHLVPAHAPFGTQPHEIRVHDLKTIEFTTSGANRAHHPAAGQSDPSRTGRRVRVVFRDGETLIGSTHGLQMGCHGFFVIPLDARPGLDACYVLAAAVKEIQPLPSARPGPAGDEPIRKAWVTAVSALRTWVPGLIAT